MRNAFEIGWRLLVVIFLAAVLVWLVIDLAGRTHTLIEDGGLVPPAYSSPR
jgi:hypothetical protein